jgi:hypothetical protein
MARNAPTKTIITATFTDLISNINDISYDLGATGRLTTNQDSDVVGAINELELGIRGTSNNLVATDLADFTANNIVSALHELDSDMHGAGGGNAKADLTTNAKSIVAAINEIEAVFDASTYEITAGANQFDVTSGDFNVNATGDITLDASGDIILDGDDADVLLKDAGTQYGALTNTSGNLIVKSGTTTALTFSGANVTTAGEITVGGTKINRTGALTLDVSGNITLDADGGNVYLKDGGTTYGTLTASGSNLIVKSGSTTAVTFDGDKATFSGPIYADSSMGTLDQTVVGAINELHDSLGDATLTTTETQVKEAINELDALQGNSAMGTSASTVTGAIAEHDAELGTITSVAMGTIASTVSGAIAELDSDRDDLITVVSPNTAITTTATTLTGAINEIDALQGDSAMGTKASTVTGAIAELHDSIGDAGLTTTATQIKEAVNELDAELGTITAGAMGTTASTVSGAISELEVEIDTLNTKVEPAQTLDTTAETLADAVNELHTEIGDTIGSANNTTTGNIGQSLNLLDSAIGDLTALDTNINDRATLVLAINSLQSDISQLDTDGTATDSKIGSLSSLNADFTGSERTSVVNALNALILSIPEIYDENGTQLN